MDLPRISIVTPSYNQSEFLEATIDSVLSQGYPRLEYVIVDGGSNDGSLEIIKKHARHLHWWCSERDGGHYAAVNKGFAHTTGEVMAWLNSDDLYFGSCLKTVASVFAELPAVQWLTSLYAPTWDASGFCIDIAQFKGFARDAFADGRYLPDSRLGRKAGFRYIQQESTFWRRDLWTRAGSGVDTALSLAGDFDLWRRFFMLDELYAVTSPLGGFRLRRGQRSEMQADYILQCQGSLAAMRAALPRSPGDVLRKAVTLLGGERIPIVGEGLRSLFGYRGKRVTREDGASSDARWVVKERKFL